MYVIVEARTLTASATRPEGLTQWNRHGHRDGYIESVELDLTDPQAAVGYTLLPPYAQVGTHEPLKVVVGGDGTEYVSVHDREGRHVSATGLASAPDGRLPFRRYGNLNGRPEDGPEFVTFEGSLYQCGPQLHLEADPRLTEDGEAVIDVTVRRGRYHRGNVFSFLPRQAHAMETIARELGLSIRTGSVETALGLKVMSHLAADAELPRFQDYVARGMGLPAGRLNSKGLRALADLKATHHEIVGGSTDAPLRELLHVMESLTGMNDPDNPVGAYEGDGWKWAMEDWSYEDGRAGTAEAATDSLRRRFVIERVRLAAVAGQQRTS